MLNLALMEQRSERFSECFSWCNKALRCAVPWHQLQPPVAVAMQEAVLLGHASTTPWCSMHASTSLHAD